ncbi:type II toxin-antitoxin system Phd/YefM family antitoxin [Corynebacterium mastitidis]|uniref:type II toxin-antitoxin system Phd/YefM family antitoxin n=1 Tax=Corynebacterium mastitidis TaxID=161890 RepID=UPI0014614AB7|nr:type II toxin-antitoxin system Phd/YefM family antitoxin [Corynebacterium mastitidis]
MASTTSTAARAHLYRLIDKVNEHSDALLITGQRHNAVLVGEEDWRAIQETLYLTSIPGMAESLREAEAEGVQGGFHGAGMVGPEWRIVYSKRARKDARNLSAAGLKSKAQALLGLVRGRWVISPDTSPAGSTFSTGWFIRSLRRRKTVLVLRMWSHYE